MSFQTFGILRVRGLVLYCTRSSYFPSHRGTCWQEHTAVHNQPHIIALVRTSHRLSIARQPLHADLGFCSGSTSHKCCGSVLFVPTSCCYPFNPRLSLAIAASASVQAYLLIFLVLPRALYSLHKLPTICMHTLAIVRDRQRPTRGRSWTPTTTRRAFVCSGVPPGIRGAGDRSVGAGKGSIR